MARHLALTDRIESSRFSNRKHRLNINRAAFSFGFFVAFVSPFFTGTIQAAHLQTDAVRNAPVDIVVNEEPPVTHGILQTHTDDESVVSKLKVNRGEISGGDTVETSLTALDSAGGQLKHALSPVVPVGRELAYQEDWEANDSLKAVGLESTNSSSLTYQVTSRLSFDLGLAINHPGTGSSAGAAALGESTDGLLASTEGWHDNNTSSTSMSMSYSF